MIHQIQIKYDALADRLLMQVRSRAGEVYAVWLTRRMMQRLWPPFLQLSGQQALAGASPGAVVLPAARAMLAESARLRMLPNADFRQPFNADQTSQPLGDEPLLAAEIELEADPQRGLLMTVREAQGRHVALHMNEELHTAMLRLFEQALTSADWNLPSTPAQASAERPALLS